MKALSPALAMFLGASVQGVSIVGKPDVFGPNGINYMNDNASIDMSKIGIDILTEGPDQHAKCQTGMWTTIHWVGHLLDGRVVTDSRAEPGGIPKTFALGSNEVFKCFDLAVS